MNVDTFLKIVSDPALSADEKAAQRILLSQSINDLLLSDFQQLVQILYRIDVSEGLLKTTLKKNPDDDAGDLIADLILKRQMEKQATKHSNQFSTDSSNEESW